MNFLENSMKTIDFCDYFFQPLMPRSALAMSGATFFCAAGALRAMRRCASEAMLTRFDIGAASLRLRTFKGFLKFFRDFKNSLIG